MSTDQQQHAHEMILSWNGGVVANAMLRRGATDRPCTAGQLDVAASERQLILGGARRFLISAVDLTVPPHHEQDKLVVFGEVLRILAPPRGRSADGMFIYYDVTCEYDSAA